MAFNHIIYSVIRPLTTMFVQAKIRITLNAFSLMSIVVMIGVACWGRGLEAVETGRVRNRYIERTLV